MCMYIHMLHCCAESIFNFNHIYCREDRPKNVYWAMGPIRGHLVVRGQGNINVEVRASK